MPFADGDTTKTQIHETLKLLHETIQKQTIATDKQSKVMIWLTAMLLIFTIALVAIGFIQLKIYEKNVDTNNNINQAQPNYKQPPPNNVPTKGTQILPPIIKGENGEKHK